MAAKHATSPIPGCKKNYGYEMPRVPTRRQQRSPAPPPSNPPGEQGLGLSLEGSRFFKKAIVKARARVRARAPRRQLQASLSARVGCVCSALLLVELSSEVPDSAKEAESRARTKAAEARPAQIQSTSALSTLVVRPFGWNDFFASSVSV